MPGYNDTHCHDYIHIHVSTHIASGHQDRALMTGLQINRLPAQKGQSYLNDDDHREHDRNSIHHYDIHVHHHGGARCGGHGLHAR